MTLLIYALYISGFIAFIWIATTTNYGILAFFTFAVIAVGAGAIMHARQFWWGRKADKRPLIHLDARMGVRPHVMKNPVPEGYRLSCLFFGSGLIDRTRTLDQGFAYEVLDRIPSIPDQAASMAELCDDRARRIVSEAKRTDRPINLLWSGGIDSTAACVALIRALQRDDKLSRLNIYYAPKSRREYRKFFHNHIKGKIERHKIHTVAPVFEKDGLVVTGELGDQLFGSATALDLPISDLMKPWQSELPRLLTARFASAHRADTVVAYLSPQIARAPVPIPTLFECLWWLNFSLKWQPVSLRMIASHPIKSFQELQPNVAHFFQTEDYQRWALVNPNMRIRDTWQSYKWPLRDYIFAFTGDRDYRDYKTKEPSLKGMLDRRVKRAALGLTVGGVAVWQGIDETLRKPLPDETLANEDGSERGISIEFSTTREAPLWDGIGDGDGE
ncbi:MAG: hypothetical protein AAF732_01005 [Pseudomonadota bacterium]